MNDNTYKKCYDRCSSCDIKGDDSNNNCNECLKDENNNYIYHFIYNDKGKCLRDDEKPSNLNLDLKDNTYKLTYEICLPCYKNYDPSNNNCIDCLMLALSNSYELINGSDFIAMALSSDEMDPKEQLKKGISALDLDNCIEQIKEYYNISKNESLIILNIESKRNETKKEESNDKSFDVGKNLQIEIYDNAGRKLNISVCKDDIKIMKFIGDLKEELNIDSAMTLASSGVDVFNASDEFFNNICHEYDNTDGKDIIINDRRTDIYKNISFCEQGCTYKGMDYELMIANCLCNSSKMQNNNEINNITQGNSEEEKVNFNSIKNSVFI